jgi:hypothetical protein
MLARRLVSDQVAQLPSLDRWAYQTPDVFYRFTRPHTMIGTSPERDSLAPGDVRPYLTATACSSCVSALVAALANISIVGLNQCYDVEIDQINKSLPALVWEFSMQTGWPSCSSLSSSP